MNNLTGIQYGSNFIKLSLCETNPPGNPIRHTHAPQRSIYIRGSDIVKFCDNSYKDEKGEYILYSALTLISSSASICLYVKETADEIYNLLSPQTHSTSNTPIGGKLER